MLALFGAHFKDLADAHMLMQDCFSLQWLSGWCCDAKGEIDHPPKKEHKKDWDDDLLVWCSQKCNYPMSHSEVEDREQK